MAKTFGLVLSDELQKAYLDFKHNCDFNRDVVTKLLNYYKGPFVTNISQLRRLNAEISPSLDQQLRSAGHTTQSLEELAAAKTSYKLILSQDQNIFPFVNINGDAIENNLTGSFYRGQTRVKAISHIKQLCSKADEICLYDKYIASSGSSQTNQQVLNFLASLLPHKKLKIVYQDGHLLDSDVRFLQAICDKWEFEKRTHIPDHHDRYLIIDNKIEIILTSGFSSLINNTKDITYIVRVVESNRFGV